MGKKRGASPIIPGMEEGDNKKQNLGSDRMEKLADGNGNKTGVQMEVKPTETLDPVKVNDAIKKLKNISRNQGDEIREGITIKWENFTSHTQLLPHRRTFTGTLWKELVPD